MDATGKKTTSSCVQKRVKHFSFCKLIYLDICKSKFVFVWWKKNYNQPNNENDPSEINNTLKPINFEADIIQSMAASGYVMLMNSLSEGCPSLWKGFVGDVLSIVISKD